MIGVPSSNRVVTAIASFDLLHAGVLETNFRLAVNIVEREPLRVAGYEVSVLLFSLFWDNTDGRVETKGISLSLD
jgi:hypothetical protein